MDIEQRIAALEARLEEQEEKRRAARDQLIALQFVMIKLLPLIAASSTDQFAEATHQAKTAAAGALALAGFDTREVADVCAAIDALREDLLSSSQAPTPSARTKLLH